MTPDTENLEREMKFAVQECGRKLGTHLRQREKALSDQKRLSLFQRYIPEVSAAIASILATFSSAFAASCSRASLSMSTASC